MTYHAEGVVASYPYTFDVDENDIGTVVAFIYDQMQITDDNKQEVLNELSSLQTQKDSGYTLMDDKVVYITKESIQDYKDLEHAEVGIRRHFIEDFIETDEDLHKIVHPYHAHTLKTEFVIEEG